MRAASRRSTGTAFASPNTDAPVETRIWGTFWALRYGLIPSFTAVPSEPTRANTLSSSTSFRVSCTELAGL